MRHGQIERSRRDASAWSRATDGVSNDDGKFDRDMPWQGRVTYFVSFFKELGKMFQNIDDVKGRRAF